jgi:hypothetical protein
LDAAARITDAPGGVIPMVYLAPTGPGLADALSSIEEHHPGATVWVENVPG